MYCLAGCAASATHAVGLGVPVHVHACFGQQQEAVLVALARWLQQASWQQAHQPLQLFLKACVHVWCERGTAPQAVGCRELTKVTSQELQRVTCCDKLLAGDCGPEVFGTPAHGSGQTAGQHCAPQKAMGVLVDGAGSSKDTTACHGHVSHQANGL